MKQYRTKGYACKTHGKCEAVVINIPFKTDNAMYLKREGFCSYCIDQGVVNIALEDHTSAGKNLIQDTVDRYGVESLPNITYHDRYGFDIS